MILLSTRPLARHRTFRRLGAIHADILLVRWSTRSRRTKRGVVSHASRRTCKASWIEDRHYSRSAKRSTTVEENDLADRGTLTYMCAIMRDQPGCLVVSHMPQYASFDDDPFRDCIPFHLYPPVRKTRPLTVLYRLMSI